MNLLLEMFCCYICSTLVMLDSSYYILYLPYNEKADREVGFVVKNNINLRYQNVSYYNTLLFI